MPHALKACPTPGCPNLVERGRCPDCRATAEHARGTAAQRGYGNRHRNHFRRGVLRRDPLCVLCGAPSTDADHYPRDRRELVRLGLDPDDPRYGRGLCSACHKRHTAAEQPGGWNA
jgi:5-methylcytosine-specific restriction enzyme A